MNFYTKIYFVSWIFLCIICLYLLIKYRKTLIIFKKEYFEFIFIKWKIVLFLLAVIFFSYLSTLWLDPTWDIPETILMSLMTYYTSPYSVWVLYRFIKKIDRKYIEIYIAIIFIFFSSAWLYDLYSMVFLLGYYPINMALANLFISPFFYIAWWIVWNLDYKNNYWIILSFKEKKWIQFKWDTWNTMKIILYSIPLSLFIIFILLYFVYLNI